MQRRAALAWLIALSLPAAALAHGGVPNSQQIIFMGDTMVVPVEYWGIFLGTDGGPWRWICEEAVNPYQPRRWALQGNGVFHATDSVGLTSSRQNGCDWVEATGEIQRRQVSQVLGDPADPKRGWATTAQNTTDAMGNPVPWNALFTTVDDGATWTPVLQVTGEFLHGVAISKDGQTIYVVGQEISVDGGGLPPHNLHVSTDAGQSWSQVPLTLDNGADLGLALIAVEPVAVDPNDANVVYLRADESPSELLMRGAPDGTAELIFQVQGTLSIGFDQAGALYIAGKSSANPDCSSLQVDPDHAGLFKSVGGAPPARVSTLDRAQCYAQHNGNEYACSWDYCPDLAAIAKLDGTPNGYSKIFQYAETLGPIQGCDPGTRVAQICPGIWSMYATQLGVGQTSEPTCGYLGCDGGMMMEPPTPPKGCSCVLGGAGRTRGGALLVLGLAVVLLRRLRGRALGRPYERRS